MKKILGFALVALLSTSLFAIEGSHHKHYNPFQIEKLRSSIMKTFFDDISKQNFDAGDVISKQQWNTNHAKGTYKIYWLCRYTYMNQHLDADNILMVLGLSKKDNSGELDAIFLPESDAFDSKSACSGVEKLSRKYIIDGEKE